MRSSLRFVAVLTAAAFAGGLSGCKKKEEKPAEKTDTPAASTGQSGDPNKKPGLGRFRGEGLTARRGLEPISVDDVKPIIPALTGAQPLGNPVQTAGGRRVTIMQCMDGTDIEKIKADLEDQLKKLGYTDLRTSPAGKRDLVTMAAHKDPFRLSATVRTGPFTDCPADQKKVKVLFSFFKRNPRPPGTPPGAAPGAAPTGAAPAAPAQPAPAPASTGGAAQ
jgi:hypothetical protein